MNIRFFLFFLIAALTLGIGYAALFQRSGQEIYVGSKPAKIKGNMIIASSSFQHNTFIPRAYTCDGDNVHPPLEVKNIPRGTKSLALIMDDPDAPGGTWAHWTVWNIDPKTAFIAEHNVPAGASEGLTSFGKPGYGGPCPPSGTHRYFFKLYALDAILDLSPHADRATLEKAIKGHILDKRELVGLYSRQ
ncbi:MAG: YbhB/YbcL family Raf kinase inhibitor-like protein [Candidatus Sungbacteria bacterium]|uniref:YbhB/YbcL family Raf kinase inhibitor-like protein n=1 Tax=Candidatus Sungiibacteriota bacterium TaxID=2750080 RepID=A0A932R162_9BACT|nr:YbhB/YbcL family Raf kinase inhibitor-like protein [Candidatus Sungbacteria bacterium]